MIKKSLPQKKIILSIILIIITLILTTTSIAQENTPIDTTLYNIAIQENIKTRTEIKSYIDAKIDKIMQDVETTGQQYIDDNFQALYELTGQLAQKLLIKAIIGTFTTILLALLTYYLIKRTIEKRANPNPYNLRIEETKPREAGIITPQYQKKIEAGKDLPTSPETNQQGMIYAPQKPILSYKEIRKQQKENDKRIKYLEKAKKEREEYVKKQEEYINKQKMKFLKKTKTPLEQAKKYTEEKQKIDEEIRKRSNQITNSEQQIITPENNNQNIIPPLPPNNQEEIIKKLKQQT
jgi:hypothetical protein